MKQSLVVTFIIVVRSLAIIYMSGFSKTGKSDRVHWLILKKETFLRKTYFCRIRRAQTDFGDIVKTEFIELQITLNG